MYNEQFFIVALNFAPKSLLYIFTETYSIVEISRCFIADNNESLLTIKTYLFATYKYSVKTFVVLIVRQISNGKVSSKARKFQAFENVIA